MSWLDDPKLARRLARVSWIVLAGSFVTITRYDFGSAIEHVLLAAMLTAVGILNAPVMVGLWKCREERHTNAYRGVALALAMRTLGTIFVLWFAAPR